MRAKRHLVNVCFAILVTAGIGFTAGCADQSGAGSDPAADDNQAGAPATTGGDPVDLIGIWTVAETGGQDGEILRLAPNDLLLWQQCGWLTGAWRADQDGLLITDQHGFGGCPAGDPATPKWFTAAVGYRVEGDDRVLLDAKGQPVARLLPGGKPPTSPDMAPEQALPPKVTDAERKAFTPAAALPAGLTAASTEQLLGRWVPVEAAKSDHSKPPYVEFLADGRWTGADGCNGQGGRWVSGSEGALLATGGVSTLMACDNVPVGAWLQESRRAGLDKDVLVLLDAAGKELGRLRKG